VGKKNVSDLKKARKRALKRREREAGPLCPKCGQGGIIVWAHQVHCSDWTTEEKVRAMTGRYGLDEAGARQTVERWEQGPETEVIELRPSARTARPPAPDA
jgi:hypothetical protein